MKADEFKTKETKETTKERGDASPFKLHCHRRLSGKIGVPGKRCARENLLPLEKGVETKLSENQENGIRLSEGAIGNRVGPLETPRKVVPLCFEEGRGGEGLTNEEKDKERREEAEEKLEQLGSIHSILLSILEQFKVFRALWREASSESRETLASSPSSTSLSSSNPTR